MKKGLLKLTVLFILAVFTVTAAYAQTNTKLVINGEEMADSQYFTENDTVYLPLRAICERLGFNVEWVDETRTVILEKLPVYITFSVDADGYTFARTAPMLLGNAPKIVDDRTYVPSNFVDEILKGQLTIENNVATINWETEDEVYDYLITDVTFVEKAEEGRILVNDFLRGDMLLNVTEETVIKDAEGNTLKVEDLTADRLLSVKLGNTMTMSLPPQFNAFEITVKDELAPVTLSGVVSEVLENEGKVEQIVVGKYGEEAFFAINVSDETKIYDINGEEVSVSDIKAGSEITASVSGTSTMSIPPQHFGYAIRIVK